MKQGDQDGGTATTKKSNTDSENKSKTGRTPLKELHFPRSPTPPPCMPLRRRRRRIGGKRTVKSCTSCRAAHVRCVADRYGVPCERCAKKCWLDCTLLQRQQGQSSPKGAAADPIDVEDHESSESRDLKQIAADALTLMTEEDKHEST
ncbi:hypothetical protein GGS21DRAFT_488210 [Xylaria nigripes]|nr:hypothetical protein GGS21DRAFT_488210 [Xylaria nigripes]